MKPGVRTLLIFLFILVTFLFVFLNHKHNQDLFYISSFKGKIEYIDYKEKGLPTLIICGIQHRFAFGGDGVMRKGDSLVKNKNSYKVQLYRDGRLETEYDSRGKNK